LEAKVRPLTRELARQEQATLRAAGTMVELEELACEIGDEFTSQLMSLEMAGRSNQVAEAQTCACLDCGSSCRVETKCRKVHSMDGSLELSEPVAYCRHCRRSFFPSA